MFIEYYEEFENQFKYYYLSRKFVLGWEEYCKKYDLNYENAYKHIGDYALSKNANLLTQRNYKTRLRRFVEYVLQKKGLRAEDEKIVIKVTKEE